MLRVLHPNRWLIWAISIAFIVFIFVWGQVTLYAAEVDQDITAALSDYREPPLGSLAWTSEDAGKIYKNDKSPLRGATYPRKWIARDEPSRTYFSNKSHQCVLAIAETAPSLDAYSLLRISTVTTDKGDIKLNIFKSKSIVNEQKYIVQPVDSRLLTIESDYVFGLIRVGEPELCTNTFGKIISTFKIAEAPGI